MEIGKATFLTTQPLDAISHIIEQWHVLLLGAERMVKEFSHKERNRQFMWFEGDRGERISQTEILQLL